MAINGGMECNVHEKRFSDDTEVPPGVWSRENSIKLSDCEEMELCNNLGTILITEKCKIFSYN